MSKKKKTLVKFTNSGMSIKVDRSALDVFKRVTMFGLKQEFVDDMFQWFYRSSLRSLILKIGKALTKIDEALTLQLTPDEVMCYRWTLDFWNEALPDSYEWTTSQQYFLTQKTL